MASSEMREDVSRQKYVYGMLLLNLSMCYVMPS